MCEHLQDPCNSVNQYFPNDQCVNKIITGKTSVRSPRETNRFYSIRVQKVH